MTYEVKTGDALALLKDMPSESVQMCVTSPPYFNLRDYGIEGQIGLEGTPQLYVAKLVEVFREVRRVLKHDGVCWVVIGDSYATSPVGSFNGGGRCFKGRDMSGVATSGGINKVKASGLPQKSLIGIPWRLAFAMQDDGWILRSEVIWNKTACMPESVSDRPSRSHENVFLFAKSPRYYYDADAIKEPKAHSTIADNRTNSDGARRDRGYTGKASNGGTNLGGRKQTERAHELARQHGLTDEHLAAIRAVGITDAGKARHTQDGCGKNDPHVQRLADEAKLALGGYYREFPSNDTRNKRTVWTVAPQPFSDAHFAVYPEKLIEPCILAGSRAGDTVLDPFNGAGTSGVVATKYGRNYIGLELNPEYAEMSRKRIAASQRPMMALFDTQNHSASSGDNDVTTARVLSA